VIAIKDIFKALSTMHREITRHTPDLKAMEKAAKQFEDSSQELVCEGVLASFAYRMKFYDHALMRHVCRQTKKLLALKLSLAVLSSNFLKANKVAEAVMRRLPGGEVRQPGGEHLPLVQGFKRCYAVSSVVCLQKELIDSEEESGHLQGLHPPRVLDVTTMHPFWMRTPATQYHRLHIQVA
jgi:hypothetical protein